MGEGDFTLDSCWEKSQTMKNSLVAENLVEANRETKREERFEMCLCLCLRVRLGTAYLAEIENFLLKV